MVELIGIYDKPDWADACLIEILVKNSNGSLDFGEVYQSKPDVDSSLWQLAWSPYILNQDGTSGLRYYDFEPLNFEASLRVAFFLHFTDFTLPLTIQNEFINLHLPMEVPQRLDFIIFEEVD